MFFLPYISVQCSLAWKISEVSRVEKAREAHEVIFHQDGLSEGQWKVPEVDLGVPLHFHLLSSEGAGETRVGGGGKGQSCFTSCVWGVSFSPLPSPPWSCVIALLTDRILLPSPLPSLCSLLQLGTSGQGSRSLRKVPPGHLGFRKNLTKAS